MFLLIKKLNVIWQRRFVFLLIDILTIPISWYSAYWLRFNLGKIPPQELLQASSLLPFLMMMQFLVFWFFGLYRGIWNFASLPDLIRILKSVLVGVVFFLVLLFFIPLKIQILRSIIPIYAWLLVSLLGGARLLYRWFRGHYYGGLKTGRKTLLVGAGQAADLLLREFAKGSVLNIYSVVAMVDDNPAKVGCEIQGIRVLGELDQIPEIINQYEIEIVVIAMPSATTELVRKVVAYCQDAKIEFRTVPGISDLINGKVTVNTLREVSIEDLLGRDQVALDWEGIAKTVGGKKILVSGGGGSIGSELCRQIACLSPALLIIVDNSEFNLYTIDKKLRAKFPHLRLVSGLIDVVDLVAIQTIITQYQPQIIFHAAAYKHVPLLEDQIRAAVRNNILGTYNLAKVAAANNVATFVLISTDKAVNPTNIMGATKRAAEIVCQNFNGKTSTHFTTVRFGNVLGSAGSVIPLFREQLASGQDLTVTHPEVTRYFMTILEATQLILQATILGNSGEIFVLDMGESIKIKTLAEQMIYLSGKKIGEEVNIVYIGLRPGEKLYEELFYSSEELLPTVHLKIKQAKYRTLEWEEISSYLHLFEQLCTSSASAAEFKEPLLKMVPEYHGSY